MLSPGDLRVLPKDPGIYLFFGRGRELLYVGKAVNLRRRVRSYFRPGQRDSRLLQLARGTVEIEAVVTSSEVEALVYEADLIREHQPIHNRALKGEPPLLYLKIPVAEEFPRLEMAGEKLPDGAFYFGPYSSLSQVRLLQDLVDRHFQLRKRPGSIGATPKRACLNHQIGRCRAPCAHHIGPGEYAELVAEVQDFLCGDEELLLLRLRRTMELAAERLDFEWAARYRDRIGALRRLFRRQQVRRFVLRDQDVAAMAAAEDRLEMVFLSFRQSRLIGVHRHRSHDVKNDARVFEDFLLASIKKGVKPPAELLVDRLLPHEADLELRMRREAGRRVRIRHPRRMPALHLLKMAIKNSQVALDWS